MTEPKATAVKPVVKPASDPAEETKKILESSEHTNFLVPLAEGEAVGTMETVTINGYKTEIRKGEMVNIPVAVANIIAEKYKIAMTAGNAHKIGRTQEVQDALTN